MKKYIKPVMICIMLVLCIFPFNLMKGINNMKAYVGLYKDIKHENKSIDTLMGNITMDDKKLSGLRNNVPPTNDMAQVIKTFRGMPNIDKCTVYNLVIADGKCKAGDEIADNAKDLPRAIEVVLDTKDLSKTLISVDNLRLPIFSVNAIFSENKVIVRYTTELGGI